MLSFSKSKIISATPVIDKSIMIIDVRNEQRVAEMVRGLRFVPGLEFATDVGYVEFLTRVKRAEEEWRANGSWDAPHPWLNLFVSSADIVDFDGNVFRKILRGGNGGVMLVYPLLKSRYVWYL